MDAYDIRPVEVDERRTVLDTVRTALLNGPVDDETFERGSASWDDCDSLAAWDGDRCVGHVGAFRFDSTVPGGARVPTAGVTRVGVLPTHTRRGLLTRLMVPFLAECRARGQVMATLHASETPIYRRFGFAIGSEGVAVKLATTGVTPWRLPPTGGSIRLLRHDEVLDVIPALYERIARWRPGTISRPLWWWQRTYDAATKVVSGQGKGTWVAVHTNADGDDDGFVLYELAWADGFGEDPRGEGTVHDMWSTGPDTDIALWRYVCDIDLIRTWKAEPRPVDEPVRRAMHDSRAYAAFARFDDQWVRLLDVDRALAARTFGPAAADVTLAVDDPMFAGNCGTWKITSAGAAPTSAAPDATIDVGVLSAAYLGAVSWRDLSTAGGLDLDDALLTRLDTLFASRPSPFCGSGY